MQIKMLALGGNQLRNIRQICMTYGHQMKCSPPATWCDLPGPGYVETEDTYAVSNLYRAFTYALQCMTGRIHFAWWVTSCAGLLLMQSQLCFFWKSNWRQLCSCSAHRWEFILCQNILCIFLQGYGWHVSLAWPWMALVGGKGIMSHWLVFDCTKNYRIHTWTSSGSSQWCCQDNGVMTRHRLLQKG